jgi:flagellar M-ring protein FliF
MFEQRWLEKIQKAVSMIPGVVVGVDVVLSEEMNSEESSVAVDSKPTTLSSQASSKSSTAKNASEGGRVGSVPNGVAGLSNSSQSVGSGGSESVLEESTEATHSVAGRTHTHVEKAGLVPKMVRASIQIPVEYYKQIWSERNPPTGEEELTEPAPAELVRIEEEVRQSVQKTVVQLLPPVAAGVDKYPLVEVASFVSIPQTGVPEPGMTDEAMGWLAANWQILAGLGLAAFAIMLLRSFVSGGLTNPSADNDVPQLSQQSGAEDVDLTEEAEAAVNVLRGRFESHGPSLRDDLGELVREDPDAAASVLRAWIGDAA